MDSFQISGETDTHLGVSQKGRQWGKSNLVLNYRPPYLVFNLTISAGKKKAVDVHTVHFSFLDSLSPLYCDLFTYLYEVWSRGSTGSLRV